MQCTFPRYIALHVKYYPTVIGTIIFHVHIIHVFGNVIDFKKVYVLFQITLFKFWFLFWTTALHFFNFINKLIHVRKYVFHLNKNARTWCPFTFIWSSQAMSCPNYFINGTITGVCRFINPSIHPILPYLLLLSSSQL